MDAEGTSVGGAPLLRLLVVGGCRPSALVCRLGGLWLGVMLLGCWLMGRAGCVRCALTAQASLSGIAAVPCLSVRRTRRSRVSGVQGPILWRGTYNSKAVRGSACLPVETGAEHRVTGVALLYRKEGQHTLRGCRWSGRGALTLACGANRMGPEALACSKAAAQRNLAGTSSITGCGAVL